MNKAFAVGAAAIVVAVGVGVTGSQLRDDNDSPRLTASGPTTMGCNDWPGVFMTSGECFAAGTIRYVSFTNLYNAGQFCKWQAANPGEWNRLQQYAKDKVTPTNIVTWLGGHIKNDLEAYFATGAPTYTMAFTPPPNRCKTPIAPPTVTGVTPGQTDVTVTVTSP